MVMLVWGLLVLSVAAASPPRYTRQTELDNYDSGHYDGGLDLNNENLYDYGIDESQISNFNPDEDSDPSHSAYIEEEEEEVAQNPNQRWTVEDREDTEVPITPHLIQSGSGESGTLMGPIAKGEEELRLTAIDILQISGDISGSGEMNSGAFGDSLSEKASGSGEILGSGGSIASGDILSSGVSGDLGSGVSGLSGSGLILFSGGEEELLTFGITSQEASGDFGESGFLGESGFPGEFEGPGASGVPGVSGESGASGFPDVSGESGASGVLEVSGESGASGVPGESGESGASGVPEVSGESGASGVSAQSGASGVPEVSGASGVPEVSGEFGASGVPELSGASGVPDVSGASGSSGVGEMSGTSGEPELSGESGAFEIIEISKEPWTSGEPEVSGTSGVPGEPGTSGMLEVSGTSGLPEVSGEPVTTGVPVEPEPSEEPGESGEIEVPEEPVVTESPEVTTEILLPELEEDGEIFLTTLTTPQEGTQGEIGSGLPEIDPYIPGMSTCVLCICLVGSVYCDDLRLDRVPPLPKETTHFYARYNKIAKISKSDFANLNKLKKIDLTSNAISKIDDDAFSGLPALDEVILRENNIRQLPALPPSMTLIDACHNQLGSTGIQREAFKDMPGLLYLYLTDNNIDHIPVPLPHSLRSLHLQNNNVQMMHDDTFCNPHDLNYIRNPLEDVRLDGNPINLSRTPQAFICLPRIPVGNLI
ncbi:epiphycan [Triplophysa dalaica]|uniref:epiphycan n=1 Tax=Triplophysa dalaica TaxID=1582913 RepID=UPI0024E00AAE|nr:epiphycan [Triplophysa dalaica]